MSSAIIFLVIVGYFFLLLIVSYLSGKKSTDNTTFFTANRTSPWWVVAIGMVGASVSGVSFISVPGMVGSIQFTYLQTVIGFFFGYLVIAHVLLPLYYKLQLTSIYTYLGQRFGKRSYITGASFFLLSKTIGAAARLYLVSFILQKLVFDSWNIPFWVTVSVILMFIWLYTFRSGIKSIVWTDTLQTIIMLVALCWLIAEMMDMLSVGPAEVKALMLSNDLTNVFVFNDWHSKQHFVKQFFSGIFIAVVMTGLDQDMMQKNLTCRNLKDAQKNMHWYGFAFIPVNLLFLILGFLMLHFADVNGINLPAKGDEILPFMASGYFTTGVFLLFILGVIAAAFSSADSALTALTTSFTVDILGRSQVNDRSAKILRMRVHAGLAVLFLIIILLFRYSNNSSIIDTIFMIVSYTYGPLLGLYAFGLFTKLKANDKWVPLMAIFSPIVSFLVSFILKTTTGYIFGYELLLLNSLIMFTGLFISSGYGYNNSRIHHQ